MLSKKNKGPKKTKPQDEDTTSMVSRLSFGTGYLTDVLKDIELRDKITITEDIGGVEANVTPNELDTFGIDEQFFELLDTIQEYTSNLESHSAGSFTTSTRFSQRVGGMRLSMDDIVNGIGEDPFVDDTFVPKLSASEEEESVIRVDKSFETLPYVKVTITRTNVFLLYAQKSETVMKNSREGDEVEEDNKHYDFLTLGKGKIRRRSEAEAQTNMILTKSRSTQTISKIVGNRGTYVSYFEMFDTYKALEDPNYIKKPIDMKMMYPEEQAELIVTLPSFDFQSRILRRVLAGNEFEESQKRYRNMNVPDRLTINAEFKYSINLLFRIVSIIGEERKAVSDISFCPANSDILAVAYGIYSFSASTVPNSGVVAIWNIKNPRYPEKAYIYNVPVVAVAFSPYISTLLAIGLYDGAVEVRDISKPENYDPIAVSKSQGGFEPAVAIKWVKQSDTGDATEVEPFLVLTQDATVTRYRIINSPFLLEFKQMQLLRIEGEPEGLIVKNTQEIILQANRRPRGLNLVKHPVQEDIFYVLTDEGCYYKCSINYQNQYLDLFRTHENSVNMMDFSPWSPKLFLTCGDDWCIRIWMEGIFSPIMKLTHECAPFYMARWSYTHSTIIIAINRKHLEIWDIRRNILQPVSTHDLDSSFNTTFSFNKTGTSLAAGNERGSCLMFAIDDLPFPPHFQYDELEKALYAAIATQPTLIDELKNIGFFGYPNKACNLPL